MVDFGKKNAMLIDMNNRVFGTLAFLRKSDSGETNYLDVFYYPLGASVSQMLLGKPLKYPHSIHKDHVHNDHATETGLAGVETDIVILFNPNEDSMIKRIEMNYSNELEMLRKQNDQLTIRLTEVEQELSAWKDSEGLKKGYDEENKEKKRFGFGPFGENNPFDNTY